VEVRAKVGVRTGVRVGVGVGVKVMVRVKVRVRVRVRVRVTLLNGIFPRIDTSSPLIHLPKIKLRGISRVCFIALLVMVYEHKIAGT
jgi:hypothetical protein